jgi:hypothetical protein
MSVAINKIGKEIWINLCTGRDFILEFFSCGGWSFPLAVPVQEENELLFASFILLRILERNFSSLLLLHVPFL